MADLLFFPGDLSSTLDSHRRKVIDHIEQLSESYVLKVNEAELILHVAKEYYVSPLEIAAEAEIIGDGEVANLVQGTFDTYTRLTPVVNVALRFTGDCGLFKLRPNQYHSNPPRGDVQQGEVRMTFGLDPSRPPESVRQEVEHWVGNIRQFVEWQRPQIDGWNQQVEQLAKTLFTARKERHLKKNSMVAAIGLQMRRRDDPLGTYSVPVPRKKLPSETPSRPPTVPPGEFVPHPALEEQNYREILGHLRYMSRTIERDPTAFAKMEEEHLRSHFLMHLNGAYEGQATGETFSVKGKTDIFLNVKERAIFIAECKFWTGAAAFGPIIDQLLGYLTWRESKAAILLFVRNADIGKVLEQIPALVSAHRLYTKHEAWSEKGEFRFLLRSARDESLPLILTVMCFHLPQLKAP